VFPPDAVEELIFETLASIRLVGGDIYFFAPGAKEAHRVMSHATAVEAAVTFSSLKAQLK
jgi:siroheme synthase